MIKEFKINFTEKEISLVYQKVKKMLDRKGVKYRKEKKSDEQTDNEEIQNNSK